MKNKLKKLVMLMATGAMLFSSILPAVNVQAEEETTSDVTQFMDCFLPMPIVEGLSSDCWGAADVGSRDQGNGLEDRDMSDYCYWDGGIIKDDQSGKYYMFASRWQQAGGHWGENGIAGWQGSQAVYAVSDNLYGPYEDKGPIWPDWCEGAGHNVFPFELSESDPQYGTYKYAISISDTGMHGETANGTIHVSNSLDGPWESIGKMQTQGGDFGLSNISILVRPDGKYEAINRNGDIALADTITGPWTVVENMLWWKVPGMSSERIEDPVIWYSEGLYHCVVNKWDARHAYYLTSPDGINGWEMHPGTAYTPDKDKISKTQYLKYEDGTVNNWTKIERPNVYIEDGTLKAMTFAVIDVQKEVDHGNDSHGSKVIVVPFAGDKLEEFATRESVLESREGIIPIADTSSQSWDSESGKNYGKEPYLQVQKDINWSSQGMGVLGEGSRPDQWYDNKISYLKYDISEFGLEEGQEIEEAYLSLVYMYQAAGNSTTNKIQATLAESEWIEGSGRETVNGNFADEGVLTEANSPALIYNSEDIENTTATSDEFTTEDGEREIKINVTQLVKQYIQDHPGESLVSFAINETETGNRIRIGSKETGEKYAAKLEIKIKEPEEIKVTGVTVSQTELNLKVGEAGKLTAEVGPADAANKNVIWTSENSSIAEVDAVGNVTAKAAGSTVVTAKTEDGGFTAVCTVTVTAPNPDAKPDPGNKPSKPDDTGKNPVNTDKKVNTDSSGVKSVKTGDTSDVMPLILIMAAAIVAAGGAGCIVFGKKRKK